MAVPLVSRLLRCGIQHIVPFSNGTVAVFTRKAVYAYGPNGKMLHQPTRIHGSRPLSVCLNENSLYYGEYRRNTERKPVRIWVSRDLGRSWSPAWTFTGIRHVHGVFHDPYTDRIWVSTGDRDDECGLWMTSDRFETLELAAGGSQQTRAVRLLFTRAYVYFGSDSPLEKNHIHRLDRKSGTIAELQAVSGSVFHGCKVGRTLYFSTAVEPSDVNNAGSAEIWRSHNGEDWRRILAFSKDGWAMKWFQYGQVFFPDGAGDGRHLYCTPFATQEHHNTIVMEVDPHPADKWKNDTVSPSPVKLNS